MSQNKFYKNQVVFITGSTGHFGACVLYKLIVVLKVAQIYVLTRRTQEETIKKWVNLMTDQVTHVIDSEKISFVEGSLDRPNLGIQKTDLIELEKSVTIIIHAAADISLKAPLPRCIKANCLPSLELARLASNFDRLESFVYVSSLYALSFLADGPVEERVYGLQDPERALKAILDGHDNTFNGYAWAYARSKHITECLLTVRYPLLPLLILRPSSIGPAINQPFELYGRPQSMPINSFYSKLMSPTSLPHTFLAARGSTSGTNILDEVPVDLVANALLQHVQLGTRGPVHANCHLYVVKTFDEFVADVNKWIPPCWKAKLSPVVFTTDKDADLCQIARFYRMCTRDWLFMSFRNKRLHQHGPLGISLAEHDVEGYTKRRIQRIWRETQPCSDRSSQRVSKI